MAEQNTAQTQLQYQDYQELLIRLPIRDDSVWVPLQKKDFKTAMNRFYGVLGYYTPKTVTQIFWKSIIEGDPLVRGDISYEEWLKEVMPRLAVIVLNIADEKLLEKIYRSLSPAALIYFNSLLVDEIEGISAEEKIDFLDEKKPWLRNFLLGSPLNAMGGLFFEASVSPSYSLPNVIRKIELLTPGLKGVFFSFGTSEAIALICAKEGLSDQQSTDISHFVGLTLIGLENPDELSGHIEKACGIPPEKAVLIAEKLKSAVIDPRQNEILSLKEQSESVLKDQEISVPIKSTEEKTDAKPVKINKVEFPSVGEEKPSQGVRNEPFMLHKEKDLSAGSGGASPFKKGSVFSFGFFKSRAASAPEKKEISVKIESSGAMEKKFSSVPVPASIFEQIKTEMDEKKEEAPPKAQAPAAPKTVHYSAFKTELPPASPELQQGEPDSPPPSGSPHVDGNKIFFK